MSRLPSQTTRPSQSGMCQTDEDYQQQRHASRVLLARVSGWALLLASATHVALIAAPLKSMIEQGSLLAAGQLTPYVSATLCVLPFTCLLARIYLNSQAPVGRARAEKFRRESPR